MKNLELNIKNITQNYLDECQALEKKCEYNKLQTVLPIIKLKEEMFKHLKAFILDYAFKDDDEEIQFFKELKPQLFSKLIYYHRVCHIVSSRPFGCHTVHKNHFMKELNGIQHYFENNIDFYKYYRSGHSHFDRHYFLRKKPDIQLAAECFYFERDPKFSTCYDFTVAKILAHDMLTVYINNELIDLEKSTKEDNSFPIIFPKIKHTWTGTKTELVELVYAINAKCSINHGNIDIKELIGYFCAVFNTDAGEFYRTYLNIKNRKDSRTLYLDSLKDTLICKMNEDDSK